MKKPFFMILSTILLVFAFACQESKEAAEESMVNVGADIEAIRNWLIGNFAAADSGDVEAYLAFLAENVILMPPNAPIMRGKSALRKSIESYFGQINTQRDFSIEEIKVAGSLAFLRINSDETYTPKTGEGELIKSSLKAIFILKRMNDGAWLCTHSIWNSNDPLPSPEDIK
jgi:ketosteroid isomerase-like protein